MCALASAYQMITDPSPEPGCWNRDPNILDQVIITVQSLTNVSLAPSTIRSMYYTISCCNYIVLWQVICGLRGGREGLVSNQRQYEFLHQVLKEMVWGRGEKGGGRGREETDDAGKTKKKKKNKKTKGICTCGQIYTSKTPVSS